MFKVCFKLREIPSFLDIYVAKVMVKYVAKEVIVLMEVTLTKC